MAIHSKTHSLLPLIFACGSLSASNVQALADDAKTFYQGRVIEMIVGFTPGGGYDLYARLVAQHIGEKIPGNPRVITRNMAGAGSRTAAGYMANVAPKDGTVLATVSQSLPLEQALGNQQAYDVTKFIYIGNPVQENNATVIWGASKVGSIDDARTREVSVGSTGDDPSSQYPKVMNALLRTKFKIISGYRGSTEINLAMERGEVEARGSSSVTEWKSVRADWLRDHKIRLLVQVGLKKAAFLPDVPLLMELATNEADRALINLLSATIAVGRPIFTTPGVPAERVAVLRQAFSQTVRDTAFQKAVTSQGLDIDPLDGEALQQVVDGIISSPLEQRMRLRSILGVQN